MNWSHGPATSQAKYQRLGDREVRVEGVNVVVPNCAVYLQT